MKPTVFAHFYRIRLRSRLGAELLALLGIAVGVALVFAALVANASLAGAVRDLNRGLVGGADLQLRARSGRGFDQRLLERVRAVPGVAAAPVAEAWVDLVGPRGSRSVLLVGGDPRSAVGGRLLRVLDAGARGAPAGLYLPGRVAAALGLRGHARVRVVSASGSARAPVAAELGAGRVGALARSPVALASLPLVQELAGMRGRLSRVLVATAPGEEGRVEGALRRIAGNRLNVTSGEAEAELFERAAYPTSASTALFSGLSALVGFLFALSAVTLAAPQRRRLIEDLRTAGFAPATVSGIVLLDALLLGLAGAALGLLLGRAASQLLFGPAPTYLSSAFAVGEERVVSWRSAAPAGAGGVLAALLATAIPLRGALLSGAVPRSPSRAGLFALAGLAALASSAALAGLAPDLSFAALAGLLLAVLLVLPAWLRLWSKALGAGWLSSRRLPPILGGLQLRAGAARAGAFALAATGAVAVFATVSIGGARADLQRGLDGVAGDLDRGAGVWVSLRGPADIFGAAAISLPAAQLEEIGRVPGVRGVSGNRGSFLDVGRDRVWVLAPALFRLDDVLRGRLGGADPATALRRLGTGRWLTLSEALAAELGVGVGDRVDLSLPSPARLRVAALTDNFGWPGGAVVLSAPLYARAWGERSFGAIGVRLRAGARPRRVAAAVRSILGGGAALRVETAARRAARQRAMSRAGLSRLGEIAALVLIASALATGASMAGTIWQRRPLFAALKVHGFRAGELWLALLLEALSLVAAGCVLGAAAGLAGQVLLDGALRAVTGFPLAYAPAWGAARGAALAVTTASALVLALPAWLAVRVMPRAGLAD